MSHLGMLSTSISFLGLMVLILAVGCLFGRRTRSVGLIVLGMAAIGMLFTRATFHPSPIYNGPPPPPIVVAPPALTLGDDAIDSASAFHKQHGDVAAQESIEALWNKLTRPRIDLELPDAPAKSANQDEIAEAAKLILSASAPGADPFTQGWLMNAAKAILSASPKAGDETLSVVDNKPTSTKTAAVEPAMASAPSPSRRPAWIDETTKQLAGTLRLVVFTDPYSTSEECLTALRDELRDVVHSHLVGLAGGSAGGGRVDVPDLERLGVTSQYIFEELCPVGTYDEQISTSVGEMRRMYTRVEFSPAQDLVLIDRWRAYARVQSIKAVGGVSALMLAGLAFVYGLLKVDTWTRGYYTKRLFLGVPAAIIAVLIFAAAVLA